MGTLGLVPARGGSKGIPRKNLAPLNGKPLISYTCDAASRSVALDRVIVSTDDEEIADTVRECGLEVPFLRPPELATDDALMIDVVTHAIQWIEDSGTDMVDAVTLLQPTSPFRKAIDIDHAIELYERIRPDTLVSVCEVPHQYSPDSLMVEEHGFLSPLDPDSPLRRQDKRKFYARNGPAILVVSRAMIEERAFYSGTVAGFVMDPLSSVDIDDELDLEWAQFLIERELA